MKFYIFLLLISPFCADAQSSDDTAVRQTITKFFDSMRKGDSAALRSTLAPGVIMQTVLKNKAGLVSVRTDNADAFAQSVGTPHTEMYDERISFGAIHIDGDLASVWTPYHFYVGEKYSHSGVNSFQLVRLAGEWKIQHVIDTRRKETPPPNL